jgi:hypothetical protein
LSRSRILNREATFIAKKLKAEIDPDGAHKIASVFHEGILILSFGIRHGAKSPHGHLVGRYGELKMSETKVAQLAQCTMSREEYIEELREIGEIP